MWDLVSCVLSIVECFILRGKWRSESFQKNNSGSRGWTCLVLSKALHLCVFGWHHKSSKIRIFRSAGVADFFGERKCLSRKWSFCRGRTLDSKHNVVCQRWRAWPRNPVFYKFQALPKSPKTTNFEIPGSRICTQFYELTTSAPPLRQSVMLKSVIRSAFLVVLGTSNTYFRVPRLTPQNHKVRMFACVAFPNMSNS